MKLRHLTRFLPTFAAFAANAPKLTSIPTEPISKKKELLFSDDFERAELGKAKGWAIVVPTYSRENGTLKGTGQTDAPRCPGEGRQAGSEGASGSHRQRHPDK